MMPDAAVRCVEELCRRAARRFASALHHCCLTACCRPGKAHHQMQALCLLPLLLLRCCCLRPSVFVHPRTQRDHAEAFEAAVADLKYGSITVNCPATAAFSVTALGWGAFPGGRIFFPCAALLAAVHRHLQALLSPAVGQQAWLEGVAHTSVMHPSTWEGRRYRATTKITGAP